MLIVEGEHTHLSRKIEVKIYKTNFHYPYIREETITDAGTGKFIINRMVANHFSVCLPNDETEESLKIKLNCNSIRLEKMGFFSRIHLDISTDPINSLPDMIEKFRNIFPECRPERDFLI